MKDLMYVFIGLFACIVYVFINLEMLWHLIPDDMNMYHPWFLGEIWNKKILPLFYNKNLFGISLSVAVIIFTIPAILLAIIVQIINIIIYLGYSIYKMGDRKSE